MLKAVLPELYNANLPFLRRDDLQLLEEVHDEVKGQLLQKNLVKNPEKAFIENIQIVRENFVRIIQILKYVETSKEKFIKHFPFWQKTRLKNVDALRDIGNMLHRDRKNCNISRLVGNSVSFVGGAMMVTSAALIPFTLGASSIVAAVGGAMIGAGSAPNIGTSLTENVLLNKKVAKAKSVIEEDQESYNNLNSWMMQSTEVTTALEKISNIDIVKNINDEIRSIVVQAIGIQKGKRTHIVKLLAHQAVILLGNSVSKAISMYSMLISILVAIIMLHERNRLVFDCASLTFKSLLTIFSVLDSTIDASEMVAKLISENGAVATGISKAVARGAVAVLSMSLDAASIILTSIDVHNGSLSEQGELILNTAEKLKREVDILQDVFDSLQSRTIYN